MNLFKPESAVDFDMRGGNKKYPVEDRKLRLRQI
jgi:hypothetical protein